MDDEDLELEIHVHSCDGLPSAYKNLRWRVEFCNYVWESKLDMKVSGTCEWNEKINVGSFDEDDHVTVFVTSKRTNLGKVTVMLKNLSEASREVREYALEPCDEGRHCDASEVSGSVSLAFAFVDASLNPPSTKRKPRGFFRRICAFLLRQPSKADVEEDAPASSATHQTSDRALSEGADSADPPTPHSQRSGNELSQKTGNDADATESELEEEEVPETQLFNIPYEEVLEKQRAKFPDLEVPQFVWEVARYIREQDGMIKTVGLFRVRGRLAEIRDLKAKLNGGLELKLDSSINIHNATSLLKSFLRELPVPLITHEYYGSFLKAAEYSGRKREKKIVSTLRQLPPENLKLIRFLACLMHDVSLHSADNKMPAENLGKVLSPNLLWKERVDLCDLSQVRDMKQANELTEVMITKYHELFDSDAEWSECSESEELVISTDEEDEEEEEEGRGGLDSLIKGMKTGAGFRKQGLTVSGTSSAPAPSEERRNRIMAKTVSGAR
eukprot:TRINITY_DN7270_c0_g2_i1.p1 TRINITY_DN7270_c0_g2~~TRINITY_DN7270_c0_g2_i1.p1  ORF type:complete len:500 (+),score=205.28 TRINITY_DN7270_c0_g2_i1:204-1703(+)